MPRTNEDLIRAAGTTLFTGGLLGTAFGAATKGTAEPAVVVVGRQVSVWLLIAILAYLVSFMVWIAAVKVARIDEARFASDTEYRNRHLAPHRGLPQVAEAKKVIEDVATRRGVHAGGPYAGDKADTEKEIAALEALYVIASEGQYSRRQPRALVAVVVCFIVFVGSLIFLLTTPATSTKNTAAALHVS